MPRQARKKSGSGIYHIMLRGINRQQIFEDEEDRQHFIETSENYKDLCGYTIYAYYLANLYQSFNCWMPQKEIYTYRSYINKGYLFGKSPV